ASGEERHARSRPRAHRGRSDRLEMLDPEVADDGQAIGGRAAGDEAVGQRPRGEEDPLEPAGAPEDRLGGLDVGEAGEAKPPGQGGRVPEIAPEMEHAPGARGREAAEAGGERETIPRVEDAFEYRRLPGKRLLLTTRPLARRQDERQPERQPPPPRP